MKGLLPRPAYAWLHRRGDKHAGKRLWHKWGQLLFPQCLQIHLRERSPHRFWSGSLTRPRPRPSQQQSPPWQPHWVHVVPGYFSTQGLCDYIARALKHVTLLCVQMNKQNSISSKSLSIKHNIFVKGKSPRTKQGAISWTSTLAFGQAYLYTKISLSTVMEFFLRDRILLCC